MRLLAIFLLTLSAPLLAQPLEPFEAEFRLHVSRIPTPIKATLELRPTDTPDGYRMQLENRSFLVKNREESHFTWNHCQPRSQHYEHEFRGFGIRREHRMDFDWQNHEVLFDDGKDKGRYDIDDNTLDELTMLLKAQCLIAAGEKEFTLTAAYGDRVRNHTFVITGEEVIDTPAGRIATIVVEKKRKADSQRRTIFWVAPSLQNMLVKARHVENRALFGELLMRSYKGPAPMPASPAADETDAEEQEAPALNDDEQDEASLALP